VSLGQQSIWEAPTAILDFETTGLSSSSGDRVVEVAIVRLEGLDDPAPQRLSSLINPGIPMPSRSQQIHGIDDNMVRDAPFFAQVEDSIHRMLDGAVFVAHNTSFDLGFLKTECNRLGLEPPDIQQIVDTLPMARQCFGFPQCGLSALARRMTIPLTNHHRAMADVDATTGIYRAMLESIDPDKTMTVERLIAHIKGMHRSGEERRQLKSRLSKAAKSGTRIEIDYTHVAGPGALRTRRQITVQSFRPPIVDAWCHLRDEPRIFRLDRIQRAELVQDPTS
jgi:DNA polymerase III epsilon subunit family exonuclease